MVFVWNKPVLTFYRERVPFEREAFAVVKTMNLKVAKSEEGGYVGNIVAFFPLMGDLDCISMEKRKSDRYVICWFDDRVNDLDESFRRLTGVTFPSGMSYVVDERGKRKYDASFKAKAGILE
jgi:hypothetical protein